MAGRGVTRPRLELLELRIEEFEKCGGRRNCQKHPMQPTSLLLTRAAGSRFESGKNRRIGFSALCARHGSHTTTQLLFSARTTTCSLHAPRPTQIGHRSASHASSKDSKEQKPQAPKQVCTQQSLNVARRFVDSIDERQGARSLARFALPITLCAPVKSRSVESFALGFSSISGNAEGSNFRLNAACNQRSQNSSKQTVRLRHFLLTGGLPEAMSRSRLCLCFCTQSGVS